MTPELLALAVAGLIQYAHLGAFARLAHCGDQPALGVDLQYHGRASTGGGTAFRFEDDPAFQQIRND